MSKLDHLHKFKRHTYRNGSQIYFCVNGDCNYKIAPKISLGKISECWRCGKRFSLDEYSIRLAKPHCKACRKDRAGEVITHPLVAVQPLMAENAASDLKERLANAIATANDDSSEDII